MSAACSVRELNVTALLQVYQGELLAEMGNLVDSGLPNPALWEEICVISDRTLCASRGTIQGCGRAMSFSVEEERTPWLNLSSLMDKEKADLLDAPDEPK